MSRIILIVGIVLVLLGGIGTVIGMVGIPLQFASTINQAVTPDAAKLCKPGETLDTQQGAEVYTPGQGYGRNVRYFCVNDAGVRREVTGDFVSGMLGSVFGSLGSMFIPALAGCILTVGIILTVVGALLSRRRRTMIVASSRFVFPEDA